VSSPARFHPPTEGDLREFVDLSLNLLCIAGTDGYFKHVNPAWETTFGYTREELLSRPYLVSVAKRKIPRQSSHSFVFLIIFLLTGICV
jgi:PAS domain S-box-containing protein